VAGIGGVLLAYQYGSITPDSYDTITALALIAFAYIAGITTVAGAVWGGLIFLGGLFAFALQDWFGLQGEWFSLLGGLLLVLTLVQQPQGIATAMFYPDRSRPRSLPFSRRGRSPVVPELAGAVDEAKVAS
jgi:branched-chain amino acid transport system permease protein